MKKNEPQSEILIWAIARKTLSVLSGFMSGFHCICHLLCDYQLDLGKCEAVGFILCSLLLCMHQGSSSFPWVKLESQRVVSLWREKDYSFLQSHMSGYVGEKGGNKTENKQICFFSPSTSCSLLGYRWERQLVFRSKLTMHTAFDRKDNAHPAEITALGISKWVSLKRLPDAFLGIVGRCSMKQTAFLA